MMVSGGLTVLSVLLALLARRPSCWLAALAMGVSTLGDALLAGYPGRLEAKKNRLVRGGLAFFAAHLLYMLALLAAAGGNDSALRPHFALPFAALFCFTILYMALLTRRDFRGHSSAPRFFHAAAFLYLLTVGIHAAAAVSAFLHAGGGFVLHAAGALLFYLSDALVLARKYGAAHGKHLTALIWFTYVPAQLCLLVGFYLGR